jgi:prevent-host-death family protein
MGQISATDANRNFSKLLRQVEKGERVTITKDGKPIAVIAPISATEDVEHQNARETLMALLREGVALGYTGPLDRDALHER